MLKRACVVTGVECMPQTHRNIDRYVVLRSSCLQVMLMWQWWVSVRLLVVLPSYFTWHPIWVITSGSNSGKLIDDTHEFTVVQDLLLHNYFYNLATGKFKVEQMKFPVSWEQKATDLMMWFGFCLHTFHLGLAANLVAFKVAITKSN